jgi:hypothetical protein
MEIHYERLLHVPTVCGERPAMVRGAGEKQNSNIGTCRNSSSSKLNQA